MASTAEGLVAQQPAPGMAPAAEVAAAGSLASLATQVTLVLLADAAAICPHRAGRSVKLKWHSNECCAQSSAA